jgi:CLIP-associating protein 1/2
MRLGDNFDSLSNGFISALFRLLVVTIKVIAESAHKCILSLLPVSSSSIPLITLGIKDKHPFLRARCTEYMYIILESTSTEKLNHERYLALVLPLALS